MNRVTFLLAILVLLIVAYIGPGSCLREDSKKADEAEKQANQAELDASLPPLLTAEESQARIDALHQALTGWDTIPSFWVSFLPPEPPGLVLTNLSRGDAEQSIEGIHKRTLSFELALAEVALSDDGTTKGVPAPGGRQASLTWILDLNNRADMHLESFTVSDDGTIQVNWTIWLHDAFPEDGSLESAE